MNAPTPTSPYMTLAEFAALIRKSPQAVRNMRHRGQAPKGFRNGREVLFPRTEVDAWLDAQLTGDRLAARVDLANVA